MLSTSWKTPELTFYWRKKSIETAAVSQVASNRQTCMDIGRDSIVKNDLQKSNVVDCFNDEYCRYKQSNYLQNQYWTVQAKSTVFETDCYGPSQATWPLGLQLRYNNVEQYNQILYAS